MKDDKVFSEMDFRHYFLAVLDISRQTEAQYNAALNSVTAFCDILPNTQVEFMEWYLLHKMPDQTWWNLIGFIMNNTFPGFQVIDFVDFSDYKFSQILAKRQSKNKGATYVTRIGG